MHVGSNSDRKAGNRPPSFAPSRDKVAIVPLINVEGATQWIPTRR